MSNISKFAPRFMNKIANTQSYNAEPRVAPEDSVISSLLGEFINSSTFAGAITSMVTAKNNSKKIYVVGAVSGYFPADPLIFPAVTAGMIVLPDHAVLIENLQNYYSRLAFARSVTNLPESAWLSDEGVPFRYWADIADVWYRVCSSAILVLHCSYDTNYGKNPAKSSQINSLHQLLKMAKSGQSPCIRDDGRLFVPGWLDQRRHERKILGHKVFIDAAGVRCEATLHDISVGGMGISACPSLPVGARISVQLADGRVLCGIITWSGDQRLGVRFMQQLSPSDTLLTPR